MPCLGKDDSLAAMMLMLISRRGPRVLLSLAGAEEGPARRRVRVLLLDRHVFPQVNNQQHPLPTPSVLLDKLMNPKVRRSTCLLFHSSSFPPSIAPPVASSPRQMESHVELKIIAHKDPFDSGLPRAQVEAKEALLFFPSTPNARCSLWSNCRT